MKDTFNDFTLINFIGKQVQKTRNNVYVQNKIRLTKNERLNSIMIRVDKELTNMHIQVFLLNPSSPATAIYCCAYLFLISIPLILLIKFG